MKVLNKDIKEKRVRVIIGNTEYGKSGICKPIKLILISDATTEEVYDKIIKVLNEN